MRKLAIWAFGLALSLSAVATKDPVDPCVLKLENAGHVPVVLHFLPFHLEYTPLLSAILSLSHSADVPIIYRPVFLYSFNELPLWHGFVRIESHFKDLPTPRFREAVLVYNRTERRTLVDMALLGPLVRSHPGSIDESQRVFLARERPTAELLAMEGHQLRARPEAINQRSPEADMDTHAASMVSRLEPGSQTHALVPTTHTSTVEFKKCGTGRSDTLKNLVAESLKRGGQSPRIVLDARETTLTPEESERTAKRVVGHLQAHWDRGYPERLHELRILGPDFDHVFVLLTEEHFGLIKPQEMPVVQRIYGTSNHVRLFRSGEGPDQKIVIPPNSALFTEIESDADGSRPPLIRLKQP